MSCSPGSSGSRTASSSALDHAAREYRADHRTARPIRDAGQPTSRRRGRRTRAIPARDGGDGQPARGLARRSARAGARTGARADSSSSSTRTSTCSRCSPTRQLATSEARPSRPGRGTGLPTGRMPDRGVDRPAAPRRGPARPPLRHPAAPGAHARHAADRQAHPRRAVRRPRLHPRPSRSGRPDGRSPPTRGGSPGRSPRRSRSRTSGW